LLRQLDVVEGEIKRIEQVFEQTAERELLKTMPGVGPILAVVIAQEAGDMSRFGSEAQLSSYAGTTPRVHASGDKVCYGRLRPDVNRYLKWAFSEAANPNWNRYENMITTGALL
jgi:transposase